MKDEWRQDLSSPTTKYGRAPRNKFARPLSKIKNLCHPSVPSICNRLQVVGCTIKAAVFDKKKSKEDKSCMKSNTNPTHATGSTTFGNDCTCPDVFQHCKISYLKSQQRFFYAKIKLINEDLVVGCILIANQRHLNLT